MAVVAVVGTQWGDEGKGKVVGYLAQRVAVVARFGGGANAGHTVRLAGRTFRLHQVPTGVLFAGRLAVVGNGAVVDPPALLAEMEELRAVGVDLSGLRLSERAHVVMPYHKLLDRLQEEARGEGRIGTTGLGIGPAYADKSGRDGIRLADLLDPESLAERLADVLPRKNRLLERLYGHPPLDAEALAREFAGYGRRLQPLVTDTSALLQEAVRAGRPVLLEGAQGTLLDIDHGSYPYVTSSGTTASAAAAGLGLPPWAITGAIGVMKAYTTRVGQGPFPTEQTGEIGRYLRERGREYGTTTGRPRRCGWLDMALVRWAVRVNGVTALAITLLDVLTGLPSVQIGVGYRWAGRVLEQVPATLRAWKECEVIYETLPGWEQDLSACRRWEELPENARGYVARIEELAGVPVRLISVGPEPEQTIERGDPLAF
mgnify:CR=1 FL=1